MPSISTHTWSTIPLIVQKVLLLEKIFQEHYKRGQYFSIEIKDNKTNETQEILLCTPLYRGKGNALDYNQKKVADGIKAQGKLAEVEKYSSACKKNTGDIKGQIATKYGSAPWTPKTITLEDTKLYGISYPKEITKIIEAEDDNLPPFYSFLDDEKKTCDRGHHQQRGKPLFTKGIPKRTKA